MQSLLAMRKLLPSAILFAAAFAACAAQVNTSASVNASGAKVDEEHKWEPTESGEKSSAPKDGSLGVSKAITGDAGPPPQPAPKAPYVGVRHDLSLASARANAASCTCLAVAVGAPADPAFEWQGPVPEVGDDTMVVAIGSEGIECNSGKGTPPVASIAGVERSGDDVVVSVEAAHAGRPTMHGAVIKRPGANGAIVIRGHGAVPFGRPLGGEKGACRIPLH